MTPRPLLLAALLLVAPAKAQTTWAIPDGGGGYLLYGPSGIGTATPDGGGGYIVRQPESYRPPPIRHYAPEPPIARPAPSQQGWDGGSPIQPPAAQPQMMRRFLALRCPALGWTVTLLFPQRRAIVQADTRTEPYSYVLGWNATDYRIGLRTRLADGTEVNSRVDIDRVSGRANINVLMDGRPGRPQSDACRVLGWE